MNHTILMSSPNSLQHSLLHSSSISISLQAYFNAALSQPLLADLSKIVKAIPGLDTTEFSCLHTSINKSINIAKDHAKNYNSNIHPAFIKNITNAKNFYNLYQSSAQQLTAHTTSQELIIILNDLKKQSQEYQSHVKSLVDQLLSLHVDINKDSTDFNNEIKEYNQFVNGENSVLNKLDSQLAGLQSKIDGAIAGEVVGGLIAIGTGVVIGVIGFALAVTIGYATPEVAVGSEVILSISPLEYFTYNLLPGTLLLGGFGSSLVFSAGVGTGGFVIANLFQEQRDLITQESSLKAEVVTAKTFSSKLQSLATQAQSALQASSQLDTSWEKLGNDLDQFIKELAQSPSSIKEHILTFKHHSDQTVASILRDIQNIEHTLTTVAAFDPEDPLPLKEGLKQLQNFANQRSL